MKFLVLATLATATFAADCEITKLTPLVATPDATNCGTESGYTFTPPMGPPSEAQMAKMCKSTSCQAFLKSVEAANIPECTLTLSVPPIQFRSDLQDKVTTFCKSAGGASNSTTDKTDATQLPTATKTPGQNGTDSESTTQKPTEKPTQKPTQKPAASKESSTVTEAPKASSASFIAQNVALAVVSVCLMSFAF